MNWTNVLIVVIVLIAVAIAGTLVYLRYREAAHPDPRIKDDSKDNQKPVKNIEAPKKEEGAPAPPAEEDQLYRPDFNPYSGTKKPFDP